MKPISFKRHRFPPDTIRLAVWLYFRFTMSLRDVEEMLAERGVDVSYETVRCWANKFGPVIAANIRRMRGRADCVWHLARWWCASTASVCSCGEPLIRKVRSWTSSFRNDDTRPQLLNSLGNGSRTKVSCQTRS